MNSSLKDALLWLRIIDVHDGRVSLTNVALIIVLVKLATASTVGLTEIGGLLIALASYQGKKVIAKNDDGSEAAMAGLKTTVEEIQSKVTALSLQAGIKKLGQ